VCRVALELSTCLFFRGHATNVGFTLYFDTICHVWCVMGLVLGLVKACRRLETLEAARDGEQSCCRPGEAFAHIPWRDG
jgi:hypothetical protein